MVDFASGLMSFATGVVKGGIEQQKKRDARELGIIEAAEVDASTEVGTIIEQARQELKDSQDVFNATSKNQIKNWNQIASEYGDEFRDDLSVLAVSRPDLFQGNDLSKIRDNVKAFFTEGQTITPESAAFKQFETDYGVGATGSSVFSSQMDAYNAKVRSNMANLVGANSTKLLLDEYIPASSQIRDRTLEKYNEGRVGREDFLGTVGQFTGADVTTAPAPKADYAGMAGFTTPADIVSPFETDSEFQVAKILFEAQGDRFSTENSLLDYYVNNTWKSDLERLDQENSELANQLRTQAAGNAMKSVMAGQELNAQTIAEAEFAISMAIKLPSDQKTNQLNKLKNQIQDEDTLNEIAQGSGFLNFDSLYDDSPMPVSSFENMEGGQLPQGLTMPPPKKLGQGRGSKNNPAYAEWLSSNKDSWNSYVDSIMDMEPQRKKAGQRGNTPEWNQWSTTYKEILDIGKL